MKAPPSPGRHTLLLTFLSLVLASTPHTARAGLLQPLLQALRPRLEAELTTSCTALVSEAAGSLATIGTLVQGACRSASKPMSECLIREAGRSGLELEVLSELIRGKVGTTSTRVIRRCISRLVGLPATGLDELLPQR